MKKVLNSKYFKNEIDTFKKLNNSNELNSLR